MTPSKGCGGGKPRLLYVNVNLYPGNVNSEASLRCYSEAHLYGVIPRPKAEESHPLRIGGAVNLMDEIPRFARDDAVDGLGAALLMESV